MIDSDIDYPWVKDEWKILTDGVWWKIGHMEYYRGSNFLLIVITL